jgi:demethylmenaquinone methyltransferase/2-methoxy-6-polyprenyl-1,4-benzoquinol methylase
LSGADLPPLAGKREFVREMFDRIAPRYDRMNRVISLGLDQSWRRAAVEAVEIGPGDRVVDLAAGTGDFAELAAVRGAHVVAVDFSRGMLCSGRARLPGVQFVQADASSLPLSDGVASVVTCGFSLRNFEDLEAVLAETARVLAPGGRLAIVETDEPRAPWLRWGHALHFRRVVPHLGALLSDGRAYRYLPASTVYLPPEPELLAGIGRAGFIEVRKARRMLGAIQQVTAKRA